MTERIYIDGQLVKHPERDCIRLAVETGHLVVIVDQANVPVQLTPELLKPK